MTKTEAILTGQLKKMPCQCCDELQCYKWVKHYKKYSSIPIKQITQTLYGGGTDASFIRWIADCGKCGRLWFSEASKKDLVDILNQFKKQYSFVDSTDSIRKGK